MDNLEDFLKVITDSVFIALLALLPIYVGYKFNKCYYGAKKIPGPGRGWPIIGHLPSLKPINLRKNISKMVERYGPLFQLRLGSWNTVFLADYDLIKKAFHSTDFANRPDMFFFEYFSRGSHGILASNGAIWQEHRRFALRHLRDLGMGRSSMETHIRREALDMIETFKKTVGQPVDFKNNLNTAVTNIVWALVSGKRMAHDDPTFHGFMDAIRKNLEATASMGIVGFIPWLTNLLPRSWLGLDLLDERRDAIVKYFEDIVEEHKATFDPNNLVDYTDFFIDEQQRQGEGSTFTDIQLIKSVGDLFSAGGETTATTLRWAFLYLSWYPDIQKKLQEEIDSVVGRERLPTFEDREMMPYTEAVILEVQRLADIFPLGIFHSANRRDVEFEGFLIPKNTVLAACASICHRDKSYWSKPDEFYPQHFLDEFGKLKKNVENFLPFLVGKRRCPGENLAKMELFYFITYFFQAFNFTLCPNDPKPSLETDPKGGMIFWPSPYKVILEFH